jgi:phosphoribosyl-AMP cyclohydrolase
VENLRSIEMRRREALYYNYSGGNGMISLDFEKSGGLIPAIAQDYRTGEVLMMAFINGESWELTLKTGVVHYWSRSRNKLWKKGEESGNVQEVKEIRVDCDNDCVLFKVNQIGDAACHTGYRSCFYRVVRDGELSIDGEKVFDPGKVYGGKK